MVPAICPLNQPVVLAYLVPVGVPRSIWNLVFGPRKSARGIEFTVELAAAETLKSDEGQVKVRIIADERRPLQYTLLRHHG